MIENGSKVAIEYTLTVDEGEVADSNVGGEAFEYEQGKEEILPALEKQLIGLDTGDTKQVTLPPEQGYGKVDPELVQIVPEAAIPEEARKVGARLVAQTESGQQRPVRVREVKDDEIVIDLNHPLAGKTLHFDVKVLSVK